MRAHRQESFGLAEIFFGPFANLFRRRRASRVPGRRVLFESLEPRLLLSADLIGAESPLEFSDDSPAALVFDAPANASLDDFTLRLNADSGELELLDGESVVLSQSLAATSGVVINGENGHDDSLTIDFDFGGVFSLADGITFNGGAGGNDALTVTGGSFTTVTHSFTDTGPGRSGTMVYEGGTHAPVVINYTDLEPLDMSGSTITDLVFNLPGANDQAILQDDGTAGNGISQIRSQNGAPTFETTTFSNTATSLTINMGDDDGFFIVASLPDYSGALTINGEGGTDAVRFSGAANFSTLAVAIAGAITDQGATLQTTGNAHFSGANITLGNSPGETANFGTLTLNSSATAVVFESSDMTLAGTSTANIFILTSTGSITEAAGGVIRGANQSAATLTAGTDIGGAGSSALNTDLASLVAISGNNGGSGGIFINDLDLAVANGLAVHEITADGGLGSIEITTAVGDITDGNFSNMNLRGSTATLTAGRHIGFNGSTMTIDALEISTGVIAATSGVAAAAGDIHLSHQSAASLRLQTISADSGAGRISIQSGGPNADLLDGNGDAVNLQGGTVTLASGRHIGSNGVSADALETEIARLDARSGVGPSVGNIHIDQVAAGGTLALNLIDADGNVTLTSAASITDNNGGNLNLRAAAVTLSAGQHIGFDGTTLDALETEVVSFGAIHSSGKVALSAAGTLTLAGDVDAGKNEIQFTAPKVVLAPSAVLNVELGGTAAGEFTHYGISGEVSLNGMLDAKLVDGFAPAPVDRFRVMEFGSSAGAFATADLPVDFFQEPHATDLELVYIPDPDIFISDVALSEGDSGSADAAFTVSLSNPSTQTVTVGFTTADGTASGGPDYQPVNGTLTFAPGETSKQVSVAVQGDTVDEFDETFAVTLSNAVEGNIKDGSGTAVILDDDPEPTISISDAAVIEGDTGAVSAVFSVSLSKASEKPIAVDFATSDITAEAGFDYQALLGKLSFAPGETLKEVSIEVNGDLLDEFDEAFTLSLSGAVNVVIGDGEALGTVLDNDPPPTIAIGDAHASEGDTGTVNAVFAVTLSKASGKPIAVDFTTSDISAAAGLDYQAQFGSIVFAPGETLKEISIAVNGELLEEVDETFAVTLSNPLNVEISDGLGVGTILDNEIPIFVEIAGQTVVEGGELSFVVDATDDPAQTLTFTVGPLPTGASFDAATREFVWAPVDDATATVTFTVTDPEGAQDVMDVVLTATNAAPTVDAGEDQLVGLQRTDDGKHDHRHKHGHWRPQADVSIVAAFDDLGTKDTHRATIDWGDGTITGGTVSEPAGNGDGAVTGEHTYKKAGTYTVKVTVTDDDGGTRCDTLLVTVKKPLERKNFDSREDRYKLKEDTVLQVDAPKGVLANDRTPLGATIEARLVEGPRHGELVLNADGSFTYVPDRDYDGKDSFWYEFTDGSNVSQAVEVTLQVQNVPEEKPAHSCIDWHDRWHAGWGHDFQVFDDHAWERFF